MSFQKMKIDVNDSQSFTAVRRELERLGYICSMGGDESDTKSFTTWTDGTFDYWRLDIHQCKHHSKKVSLTKLKRKRRRKL